MIRLQQVGKRYPAGQDALQGIDLEVKAGELLLVSGRSGAGKSTLLKLIATLERPTVGTLLIGNQNVGTMKQRALAYFRRNIGIVLQDQKLLFDRTAFENVILPLTITGFPRPEAIRRTHAALDKVGLLARAQAMPVALSGGEQQRLAIARAVVRRPNLLLADEPTAHLDAETARDVARIFLEFNQVGVTVLIATYDPGLFAQARIITLEQGRVQR